MRFLQDLSGPWVGFWVQDLQRGSMHLSLRFDETNVAGDGSDVIGAFTIEGKHETSGAVTFVKRYATHRIRYAGTWDGTMIAGRWQIGARRIYDEGEFEIWPERDDQAIERMEAALALTA